MNGSYGASGRASSDPPANPYPPGRHHYALSLVSPLPTTPTILDYGCWDGGFIHKVSEMTEGGRSFGCDVDGDAIARAIELHGDAVTFFTIEPGTRPLSPLDDGSVSIAFLCDVLEHLGDGLETAVLGELARVLAPDGILIVTVPHRGALAWADPENFKFRWPALHRQVYSWLHGRQSYASRYGGGDGRFGNFSPGATWHRHYSVAELEELLAKHGFRIEESRHHGLLSPIIFTGLSMTEKVLRRMGWPTRRLTAPLWYLWRADAKLRPGSLSYDVAVRAVKESPSESEQGQKRLSGRRFDDPLNHSALSYRLLVRLHKWGSGWATATWPAKLFGGLSWAGFVSMLVVSNPLVRHHRGRALSRLWAWEIWRRVARRPIEVVFDNGTRLLFPPSTKLAGVVAATGSHEPTEQTFILHLVRPGDVAVDVGANVGIYSVALAALGARVWAFEPSSAIRPTLAHNVGLNAAGDRVRILPFAVGAENGQVLFTSDLEGTNHLVRESPSGPTETVEIRTLDNVASDPTAGLAGEDVFLVKIDAEGEDEAVLRGASALLERCHPVVIVETWGGGDEIRRLLAKYRYRTYRYEPGTRHLIEFSPDWSGQANFIGVAAPREDEVRIRLANAPDQHLSPPRIRWLRSTGPGR